MYIYIYVCMYVNIYICMCRLWPSYPKSSEIPFVILKPRQSLRRRRAHGSMSESPVETSRSAVLGKWIFKEYHWGYAAFLKWRYPQGPPNKSSIFWDGILHCKLFWWGTTMYGKPPKKSLGVKNRRYGRTWDDQWNMMEYSEVFRTGDSSSNLTVCYGMGHNIARWFSYELHGDDP